MGILEKMQNWDTWEVIAKDSDSFLEYISTKFLDGDYSFVDEVDDLEKVIDRLQAEFDKVFEEARPHVEAFVAAVNEMSLLYRMIDDRDKFYNLLTSETELTELDKTSIIQEWEDQRASCTKVVKSLGSETIEECLKRKSVEVSEARPKANQLEPRKEMISEYVYRALGIKRCIELYTDVYGWSPPPSPTNTWVSDNIGSSSSPTNKRVKHNTGSTSSLDESFVLPC